MNARERLHTAYRWRLYATARSGSFKKSIQHLEQLRIAPAIRSTLAAILLIEMTERPAWIRLAEWVFHRLAGLMGRSRVGPRTLGPFQMSHAPLAFTDAVIEASRRLEHITSDEEVARLWYGTATRRPGSFLSYPDALEIARRVLEGSVGAEMTRHSPDGRAGTWSGGRGTNRDQTASEHRTRGRGVG